MLLKRFGLVFLLIFISAVPLAYAHPLFLSSEPARSQIVAAGVDRVVIHFSEAVEIDFSYIRVFDSDGNQVDNKNTRYYDGTETSLIVTTPPLKDGIYTVTTQVLSKVDGHLVPYAYVFGVGNVSVPPADDPELSQTVYLPEAASRFPGLVGQTIVLGSAIAALILWRPLIKKKLLKEDLAEVQKAFQSKFFAVSGIGLFLVFASNILMLVVQTIRLETSASDVLRTSFGEVWILRMAITIVLLAVWFLMENKANVSSKKHALIASISLVLISTTTVIGHGAASQQALAVAIDYAHNLLAAVWIGGVIFFGFVLLPAISGLKNGKKEKAALVMIPRFSSTALIAVGIVIVTGPTLLWLLEDDVSLLSRSYYGYLIIAKIVIGSIMVALGAYNQLKIQRPAEKLVLTDFAVHKKLKRSLKAEAMLGIALLGMVALLANSSLPVGSMQEVQAKQVTYGFDTSIFSEKSRFDVNIYPFTSGENTISIFAQDLDGARLDDVESIRIKVSNAQRNITPIDIPVTLTESGRYEGQIAFGFSGTWNVEILVQRTEHANDVVSFSAFVKPRLPQLKADVTEYAIPVEGAAPLYPAYDGDDTIWISDASKPRLWKFSISQKEFTPYEFDGKTTVFLKVEKDRVWFTDTPEGNIGYLDLQEEEITVIPLPTKAIPVSLESDFEGNIWIALADRHSLLKYSPKNGMFEEFTIPTNPSGPVALAKDSSGKIWFVQSQGGKIGSIDPQTGNIDEYAPDELLKEPFALFIDKEQNVWIAEHTGIGIAKFNPFLQTFERISVSDQESLPFGLAADKFENIWIAQHTVDKLGVYDPHNNDFVEVEIPTKSSFTQFVTSDKNGNIWFVEQRGNKIGNVVISETHQSVAVQQDYKIRYAELVTPLISAGIIATSLFFAKSIHDKRRIDSQIP
jgi:copper transport protein